MVHFNKGGRPRKLDGEKMKYKVSVKMSTLEYYTLKSKAKDAGVTRSEFIRDSVMNTSVVHRLKDPDKTKYEIYNRLKELVPKCKDWAELESGLKADGITVNYKCRGNINVVQGISFTKNNLRFNGSKVDRQFSYSKIKYQLDQNKLQEYFQVLQNPSYDYDFQQLIRAGLLQAEKDEERQRRKESYQGIKPQKRKSRGRRM